MVKLKKLYKSRMCDEYDNFTIILYISFCMCIQIYYKNSNHWPFTIDRIMDIALLILLLLLIHVDVVRNTALILIIYGVSLRNHITQII